MWSKAKYGVNRKLWWKQLARPWGPWCVYYFRLYNLIHYICCIKTNVMAITVQKKVKVDNRYIEFLKTVSAFNNLNLSDREIEVLDSFFWSSEGKLTTDARQEVAEKLGVTEYNLNNQILKLRRKKLISKVNGDSVESILPSLMPDLEIDKTELGILFILTSA